MARRTVTTERTRPAGSKRWALILLVLFAILGGSAIAGAAYVIGRVDRTPREWSPYITRRAAGNSELVMGIAGALASLLNYMDRTPRKDGGVLVDWVGARRDTLSGSELNPADPRDHLVGSVQSLDAQLRQAQPGDVFELLPGNYRIDGRGLSISQPGRQDAPIILRAAQLGQVVIDSSVVEAIKINAPYWHFENLIIRGRCAPGDDSSCEHAFHIVGNAKHIMLRNNTLIDFNAHIKINGEGGSFPDSGIIDHNTLTDLRPRATPNPVTPIDLDAASDWVITGNLISDFVKSAGDRISYGAFAKAAGANNAFERNVVLCEDRLRGETGQRVGISLGGGGSGEAIRRDGGRSGLEHVNGRISDNLIAFCSDQGIYINRAQNSQIDHNTLLDTSGIEVRFPQSSANINANIIDGAISARDGGLLKADANDTAGLPALFLGWHPQRRLFVDVGRLDLTWRGDPPRTSIADSRPDLCGAARPSRPAIGAFEDFAKCMAAQIIH
jgi:hypothetical protein